MLKLSDGDIPQYEFVMPSNSTGILAVNYYSELNNLTDLSVPGASSIIYPWKIDTVNNRIDHNTDSHVVIEPVEIAVTSIHNITVYYLIDTRNLEPDTYGVYVIPSHQLAFKPY